MAIDKIFNDANVDGIADNIFGAVNNSVSEVKQMQQRKAAENVQMVVEAFKKIETNITEKFDNVTDVIEKRVLTIKDGRDGSNGSDGRNGRDGKPGRDGVNGKQGTPGTPGKDGTDGVDGVSVTDANIDFDGSLVISLSSGQQINVGEVVAPDLAEKIKIVSTMSTNGAVGIKDEGSSISTGVKNINFVGATVTATASGDDVTVNVSAGTGTVQSVAATVPAFLSVAGSPITTTGTLAISLSGTALPVANGGTGITSFGTGVATALGVNTGTAGAFVVNGGALGTPSSGTVTNLTGTASININGTVGATTASTGAFTTLSATGNLTSLTAQFGTNPAGVSIGVIGIPNQKRIYGRNAANNADVNILYVDAGNSVVFGPSDVASFSSTGLAVTGTLSATGTLSGGTSGTGYSFSGSAPATSLTLDASGLLGIGTAPSYKLHVVKGSSGITARFTDGDGITDVYGYGLEITRAAAYIKGSSALHLGSAAGYSAVVLDSSGNLGIGTTSPGNRLDVQINLTGDIVANIQNTHASGYSALQFKDNAGVQRLVIGYGNASASPPTALAYLYSVGDLTFRTGSGGGTERMRLDSSGNLGIGTSSPTAPLSVFTSTAKDVIALSYSTLGKVAGVYIDSGSIFYGGGAFNYTNTFEAGHQTNYVAMRTGGTERARITSGGYFKASNTGTYNNASGDYHELRNDANTNTVRITNTIASGYTDAIIQVAFTDYTPNTTNSWFLFCNDSTTNRIQLRSNGGIANYSANDVNLSDRREKTNFAPAGSYLDKICAIPVRTFNYIDQNLEEDDGLTLGVIAQDVQAIAPELVMESDWAKEGDEPKMRLSIYQTDLQYALMKCIQEQQALITQLTARITALETT